MGREPEPDVIVHACYPSAQEAEAGRLLQVPGQPGLQCACPVSQKQKKPDSTGGVEVQGLFPDLAWLIEAVLTEDSEAWRQESER